MSQRNDRSPAATQEGSLAAMPASSSACGILAFSYARLFSNHTHSGVSADARLDNNLSASRWRTVDR